MTGLRSALVRHGVDGIPRRVPRGPERNGWRSAHPGAERMAFRRAGCGKGTGATFSTSLTGDG
jgi:hypothetical protein